MAATESSPHDSAVPPVQYKAPRPPGVLPPHAQTWVMAGIALLILAIVGFSQRGAPQAERATTRTQSPLVTDPDQQRIKQYAARLDEQLRQLAAEKTQLALTKRQLELTPNATPWVAESAAARTGETPPADAPPARQRPRADEPEVGATTDLAHERARREYESLFASNIALSYRDTTPATRRERVDGLSPPILPPVPSGADSARPAVAAPTAMPPAVPAPVLPTGERTPTPRSDPPSDLAPQTAQRAVRSPTVAPPDLSQFPLWEGTVIETVLTNRLTGSFAGPVNCMVTTAVYTHDRQHLLIPPGSRVLGEVRRVDSVGQERLAVVFHRLILPNGTTVTLDQFHGLNQIGQTGLADQIDRHYAQTFGISIALGGLAGLAQAHTSYSAFGTSAADASRQGVAANLSQSSMRMLDRYLNVLPTFTIREGHRVKIYLSADLQLPAYQEVPR